MFDVLLTRFSTPTNPQKFGETTLSGSLACLASSIFFFCLSAISWIISSFFKRKIFSLRCLKCKEMFTQLMMHSANAKSFLFAVWNVKKCLAKIWCILLYAKSFLFVVWNVRSLICQQTINSSNSKCFLFAVWNVKKKCKVKNKRKIFS